MQKNHATILRAFAASQSAGQPGDSCWTDGTVLYSYRTPIAVERDGDVLMDGRRYSVTTTRLQNAIRREYPRLVVTDAATIAATAQAK